MLTEEQKQYIRTVWLDLGPDAPSLYDMENNMERQLSEAKNEEASEK